MSGEPKTLTPRAMTLEEFLAELGNERNAYLARYGYPDGTEQWAVNDSWSNQIAWAHTWPELATKVLGVRVVARDEVAELRAALDVARDAMVSALVYHHHSLGNPVKEELNAAVNRAGRALAGGENEK